MKVLAAGGGSGGHVTPVLAVINELAELDTSLTVRFGTEATDTTDSLCYLASDAAPTVVYEVNADHKAAFAVTKETLYDVTATAEPAATTDGEPQHPEAGGNADAASLADQPLPKSGTRRTKHST